MKKRLLAVLLSLLLCLGLFAGCGEEKASTSTPATATSSAPAPAASTTEASAQEEEKTTAASAALTAEQAEYWVGDWYGIWSNEESGGSLAEHNWPGDWIDCLGRSTLNADGTITLKLWGGDDRWSYEKPVAEVTFSVSAETNGSLGIATSVSGSCGYYTWPEDNAEIAAGEWVLDPASTDYDRLICLRATYNGATKDDYASYSLLLRPWGMLWDDICPNGDNHKDANGTLGTYYTRPMQYTQYYVPVIENNYPISKYCFNVLDALRNPLDGVRVTETFDFHGYSVTYPIGYFTKEGVSLEDLVSTDYAFAGNAVTKVYFRDIGTTENLAEHYATKADYATRSDVSGFETWDSTVDGYVVHNYVYELQGWGWYYEAYIDYGGDIGTAAIHQSSYAGYIYFRSSERDAAYNEITEAMVNSFVFQG